MEEEIENASNLSAARVDRKAVKHRKRSNSKAKRIAKFEKWMENEVGLPEYIELFHDQHLGRMDKVKGMQEEDLQDIGIEDKAHRLLIVEHIVELRSRKQSAVKSVPLNGQSEGNAGGGSAGYRH